MKVHFLYYTPEGGITDKNLKPSMKVKEKNCYVVSQLINVSFRPKFPALLMYPGGGIIYWILSQSCPRHVQDHEFNFDTTKTITKSETDK
jgi:hypothetical protein